MRLIDADALSKLVGEPIEVFLRRLDLKLPPTVDAVEVVRCKDCKWYEESIYPELRPTRFCYRITRVFILDITGTEMIFVLTERGEKKDERLWIWICLCSAWSNNRIVSFKSSENVKG